MMELKEVSFSVPDIANGKTKTILNNITLAIEDDSFLVITGPNGGGKSTLAKIIMGIERPTSGRIYLDGEDITDLSVTDRAKKGIGFSFQQPVRFKGISVSDMLSIAAGKDLTQEEACSYLSKVGMCAKDYVNRELNATLSGGEIKRIEIAMLLARGTRVSVFDEPEAGIDLWSFQSLIRVFHDIKNSVHGSAVIISHQERILAIADTIAVITNGEISRIGPREEILPSLAEGPAVCDVIKGANLL